MPEQLYFTGGVKRPGKFRQQVQATKARGSNIWSTRDSGAQPVSQRVQPHIIPSDVTQNWYTRVACDMGAMKREALSQSAAVPTTFTMDATKLGTLGWPLGLLSLKASSTVHPFGELSGDAQQEIHM